MMRRALLPSSSRFDTRMLRSSGSGITWLVSWLVVPPTVPYISLHYNLEILH